MGMNTLISEGEGGISGGQKQRLMIARVIAPRPKILIFDEATSTLDNVTQKIVSDSLSRLECTRIVVAHRLSTIRECGRILVLDQGRIIGDGTYDELLRTNPFILKYYCDPQHDPEEPVPARKLSRYFLRVIPVTFLKVFPRWLCDANPRYWAMSVHE